MSKATNPPKGECRQCWQHAYDKSIHKRLKPKEDCGACVNHMQNGHPSHMIIR